MGCWRLSVKHQIKLRLGGGIIASAIIDWSINSLWIDSLTCWFLRVSNCHPYNMSPRIQGIVTSTSKPSHPILLPTAQTSLHSPSKKAVLSEKKRCAINPSTSKPIKLNNHRWGNVSTTSSPQGFPNREKGMSCQDLREHENAHWRGVPLVNQTCLMDVFGLDLFIIC